MTRRLGVLGGTFDPVHLGHLDAADAARHALALDEILFIPSHDPPHRPVDPRASAFHRFALISLAIQGCPGYRVSDLELRRRGSSYTFDTLQALHARGWTPERIFFILGADAFADIATWYAYPAVLEAAHFAVIARPGTTLDDAVARIPDLRARTRTADGDAESARIPAIHLVHVRTRDVSSTTIRQRLSTRRSIDDLVPQAVARHIAAHHLYETEDDLHGTNEQGEWGG